MNFEEYISKISFRLNKPQEPSAIDRKNVNRLSFELENTILPHEDIIMKKRLQEVCKIPKMSTFAIGAIINKAVSTMKADEVYVNVGVWQGFTLLSGMIDNPTQKCIGVDNWSEFGSPKHAFHQRFNQYKSENHRFFNMDYSEYFSRVHQEPIGVYCYDGHHSYKDQLMALEIAEPFFSKNCIILVDDTNPGHCGARQATLDFISNRKNGYKLLMDTVTISRGHPTFWNGIMIVQKGN